MPREYLVLFSTYFLTKEHRRSRRHRRRRRVSVCQCRAPCQVDGKLIFSSTAAAVKIRRSKRDRRFGRCELANHGTIKGGQIDQLPQKQSVATPARFIFLWPLQSARIECLAPRRSLR